VKSYLNQNCQLGLTYTMRSMCYAQASKGVAMPQLHLYVSNEIAEALKRKSKAQGMSVSKYLAEIVRKDLGVGFPEHYDEILGGWQGELPSPRRDS
jgi:hypothetical protein